MSTRIDVIAGFLESGKTTFIQYILSSGILNRGENVVILLCELGEEEFAPEELIEYGIYVEVLPYGEHLNEHRLNELNRRFTPARIFIEYNGTWAIEELLKIRLPRRTFIGRIFFIADANTILLQIRNMGSLASEQIANSDAVLINRHKEVSSDKWTEISRSIRKINRKTKICVCPEFEQNWVHKERFLLDTESSGTANFIGGMCVFLFLWMTYVFSGFFDHSSFSAQYQGFLEINTVFLSILIQALPFLMLGVFISAFLQTFVSERTMIRLFSQKHGRGFLTAIFLGIFFPVCDCAMVPITARLIRKGSPVPQALTFMMASPAVNPVVILSTWYAFQGESKIMLWRIAAGILIAVSVGGILLALEKTSLIKRSDIILQEAVQSYAAPETQKEKKWILVLRQAGTEFFRTVSLVVFGALGSAVITHFLPADFFANLAGKKVTAVLLMLAAAFVMSVCANSNAFIARNFVNSFPISAVLGFMVMGPMLDLKNLLILSTTFSKKFILLFVGILLSVSFIVFMILTVATGGVL